MSAPQSKPDRFKWKKAMRATSDELEESESKEDSNKEDALICVVAIDENEMKVLCFWRNAWWYEKTVTKK